MVVCRSVIEPTALHICWVHVAGPGAEREQGRMMHEHGQTMVAVVMK